MNNNLTVLILGAGQVGNEIARQLMKCQTEQIILHCLTEEEATEARLELLAEREKDELLAALSSPISIEPSWGNIFWPTPLAKKSPKQLDVKEQQELIYYNFGPLTNQLIQGSLLHQIIDQYRPKIIIDAINTATALGYKQDLYEVGRRLSFQTAFSKTDALDLLDTISLPKIVRFVQILKESMEKYDVKRYIKISTTGLGGMGFNIRYTHGDLGEPGLSTKLLGKVSAAGILHQLLWTLSHTPGFNVNLIIPASLVGWGKLEHRPLNTKMVDCQPMERKKFMDMLEKEELEELNKEINKHWQQLNKILSGIVVDSGENGPYGLGDMTAITALGQMGCITKEEVAHAVISTIMGDTHYDVLTAMDSSQLNSSMIAYSKRRLILDEMAEMAKNIGQPSASFGGLGPQVAKYLYELEILGALANTLNDFLSLREEDLPQFSLRAQRFIQKKDSLRQTILTLGLSIITEEKVYAARDGTNNDIDDFRKVVKKKVVDLSKERWKWWQEKIQELGLDKEGKDCWNSNLLELKAKLNSPINPGEILAAIFTASGGEKKVF